ncbi:MAG TPA: hypothetical protein VF576_11485 [Rubricoccaceae bacterium]|jgi:hypothetical protein
MPTATPTPPTPRARKAPVKAPVKAPAVARPAPALVARKARRGTALPGWADLDGDAAGGVARHGGRGAAGSRKATQIAARKAARVRPLDAVPSLRFGLLVLIACVVGTLFVAHVYATRATLAELQDARRESEHLRLAGQRLRGEFDRMTGPDAVMPRAAALGLQEGVAYGVPIHLP